MKTAIIIFLLIAILVTTPIDSKSNIGNKRGLYTNEINNKLTDNAITLFNKEVEFGMSSDMFKSRFNEFKLDSKEGNDLNYKFETNYSDFFSNYWITVKFTDNKLICLELNGWQTEEYMKMLKATMEQMKFDKTITTENEDIGSTSTDYYHKDDLKAEYYNFETAVLKIYLNN